MVLWFPEEALARWNKRWQRLLNRRLLQYIRHSVFLCGGGSVTSCSAVFICVRGSSLEKRV